MPDDWASLAMARFKVSGSPIVESDRVPPGCPVAYSKTSVFSLSWSTIVLSVAGVPSVLSEQASDMSMPETTTRGRSHRRGCSRSLQ